MIFFSEARPVSQFHRWEVVVEGISINGGRKPTESKSGLVVEGEASEKHSTLSSVKDQIWDIDERSENQLHTQICLDKVAVVPGNIIITGDFHSSKMSSLVKVHIFLHLLFNFLKIFMP